MAQDRRRSIAAHGRKPATGSSIETIPLDAMPRRCFLIGAALTVGLFSAPGGAATAASAAARLPGPRPDFTVLVVDRSGETHLVAAYGDTIEAAVMESVRMLAEDITDDAGYDDDPPAGAPNEGHLADLEAVRQIDAEIWMDDCLLIRAWPGYHPYLPPTAPMFEEGELGEASSLGARIAVAPGIFGEVVGPFSGFDDFATVSVIVPAAADLVGPGRTLLRQAALGRMAVRQA